MVATVCSVRNPATYTAARLCRRKPIIRRQSLNSRRQFFLNACVCGSVAERSKVSNSGSNGCEFEPRARTSVLRSGCELTVRTSHFAKQSFYFRKKCETNYAKKRKIAKLEVQYFFSSDSSYV